MTTASTPMSAPLGDALLEIASGAVLVVDDVSWRVVAASVGAERLYGGPLAGIALENLFGLEGETAVERTIWRAQTGAEPVEASFEERTGGRRHVRMRARRVALEGCTVAVVALDDVTRERELERALAASRDEQRALVDALGIGVVALDTSGRVVDHNRFEPFERTFGAALVGRNFFLDVATSPEARAVFQRYQAWAHAVDQPPYSERFEFETGRSLVEAELHAGVGIAGWDAIVRLADATERRATEHELRRQTFEAEEAVRRARLVYQTASLIHRSLDLEEVFSTAAAETGRLLGASRCQVALVDEAGQLRVAEEYRRPHLDPTPSIAALVDASPTIAEAVRGLHPVAIEAVDAHPLAENDALLAATGARAALVAPIAVRREPRGVLLILQVDRARRWTSGEVDLAASIASQVGLAIGHVEIHERVRRQAERESVVGRLAAEVHAAGTLEGALERAGAGLVEALGAERAAAALAEPETTAARVWSWRRDATGAIVAEASAAGLTGALAAALDGAPAPAGIAAARFQTRDGAVGALAVAAAGDDAAALVEAAAAHVGVAVGAAALLEAVTSAKQVWEGTFDAMSDGIVLHDEAFTIERVNRAFARLVRSQPLRLVGASYLDLFTGPNREAVAAARDRVAATRRPVTLELEEPALGRYLSISVARLAGTALPGYIHTVRDVTEGRQMHERLAQSAKMASIGNLAAGVAHEINTPLATIAGSAQSLARQLAQLPELGDSPRWGAISARLEAIVEQSFRCKRITHDLLNFAAPVRPSLAPTDVARVAREAVETVERTRGGRVRIRETGAATAVACDADLLGQVLINLVTNGLDAVEERGAGTVSVEVRHLARETRVAVKDTGTGIAAEDIDRVFDPFFTTKPPGRGTGLGLAISQSICATLGGHLAVESRRGRGSTFTIHLPREGRGEV